MAGNGGIIGPANIPAASGFSSVASGVWSLTEAQENNSGGKWPEMPPTTYDIFWLVIAGGGAGGGPTQGGGGGAGGYRSAWNSETSGGGGSAESAISVDNLNGGAEDVNSGQHYCRDWFHDSDQRCRGRRWVILRRSASPNRIRKSGRVWGRRGKPHRRCRWSRDVESRIRRWH